MNSFKVLITLMLLLPSTAFSNSVEERNSIGIELGKSAKSIRSGVEKLYTPPIDLVKDARSGTYRLIYRTRDAYDQFIYDFKKGYSDTSDN